MGMDMTAAALLRLAAALVRSRRQLCDALALLDPDRLEAGVIGIHQDICNKVFRDDIRRKLDVEDFEVRFSGDCVRLTADKLVSAVLFEKVIRAKIKLYNIDLVFTGDQHYLTVDFLTEFEGIPAIVEKMPGGGAIRDMLVNSLLRHKLKDVDWIDIKGERIYADISRIPAFSRLQRSGSFGADLIAGTKVEFLGTESGALQFSLRSV